MKPHSQLTVLWKLGMLRIGNPGANNAKGKGNRAARRAGWRVTPTAGPDYIREMREFAKSI
jgi:hypothetical protein